MIQQRSDNIHNHSFNIFVNSTKELKIIEDYQDDKKGDKNGKGPQNQPSFLKNMLEGAIFLETKAAW